jgi:hypothetical protein
MPARVVDGDGLWRSKKLKKMSPAFRGEYANLVPLAEANGVFDCDPDRVWSDVYAFNRPEIDVETVERILYELEAVDLLRRWTDKDKTWGYWTGIHKSGRLPTGVHLKRYKNLPPEPPTEIKDAPERTDLSGIDPGLSHDDPAWFGIGLDRNGIGLVGEDETNESPFSGQEEELKAEKQIAVSCQQILGQRAETYPDVINQIRALAITTSNGQVVQEFEEWALDNQGDDFRGKPITAFLRSRDAVRVAEARQASEGAVVTALAREIAYRSDNTVTFDHKQKVGLRKTLDEGYEQDEIVSVFKEFFGALDQNNQQDVRYAAKNFVEKAADMCWVARKKQDQKEREAEAIRITAERIQREAEEDRRARQEAAEREAQLVEEELPD